MPLLALTPLIYFDAPLPHPLSGTGLQGELWWARAFAEATQQLNFSLAANATPWAGERCYQLYVGVNSAVPCVQCRHHAPAVTPTDCPTPSLLDTVMVGSAVHRSQHQMHLRIDDLVADLDSVQARCGG